MASLLDGLEKIGKAAARLRSLAVARKSLRIALGRDDPAEVMNEIALIRDDLDDIERAMRRGS